MTPWRPPALGDCVCEWMCAAHYSCVYTHTCRLGVDRVLVLDVARGLLASARPGHGINTLFVGHHSYSPYIHTHTHTHTFVIITWIVVAAHYLFSSIHICSNNSSSNSRRRLFLTLQILNQTTRTAQYTHILCDMIIVVCSTRWIVVGSLGQSLWIYFYILLCDHHSLINWLVFWIWLQFFFLSPSLISSPIWVKWNRSELKWTILVSKV